MPFAKPLIKFNSNMTPEECDALYYDTKYNEPFSGNRPNCEAAEKDASRRFAEQRKIDSRREHARSVGDDSLTEMPA